MTAEQSAEYVAAEFRKKPVVITAMPHDGTIECVEALHWWSEGAVTYDADGVYIQTLEGRLNVSVGDVVIKGVQGEFYPCKPDIFDATYERHSDGSGCACSS